jgi:FKBP-type peptidyl-prolyl cis-trans isomerase FkpA
MNKKQVLMLAIVALSFTVCACKEDAPTCVSNNTGIPTAKEVASLQTYITANNITATQHPDGFFYHIKTQGTGATPTQASTVYFKYTGKLTNGVVFDTSGTTPLVSVLSGLILGFRRGMPLIQKGGSIDLYIPPSLGYGCSSLPKIPAGSNLIFNVDLTDVQ